MISNAANRPLFDKSGTAPDVSGALQDTFQPMIFNVVEKKIVGFQNVEKARPSNFNGTWQPLTGRQLLLKPEGQRAWSWYWVFADPVLQLTTDQIVIYKGKNYRVMVVKDYSLNGFMEYHLIEDFIGAGP